MLKQITLANIKTLYQHGSGNHHLIVLHGYGASCDDLVGIASQIDPNHQHHWYFLDGIVPLRYGQMEIGRAWFDMRLNDVLQAVDENDFQGIEKIIRPSLEVASQEVSEAINSLGIESKYLSLCGFSQGAMLATEIFLQSTLAERLILYSGAFASPLKWRELLLQKKNLDQLSIFQSHGRQDPVLQYKVATPLKALFEQFNLKKYCFVPFDGQHEIPAHVLQQTKLFMNDT